MPVFLAEDTFGAVGLSVGATYWIILPGAGFLFKLLTASLEKQMYSSL